MCSGSEAGSYLRIIDFAHHSTLNSRVIKKRRRAAGDFTGEGGRVQGSWLNVQVLGYRVQGLGFRIDGSSFGG